MKLRVSLLAALAAGGFAIYGDWRLFGAIGAVALVIAIGDLSVSIKKAVKEMKR